MKKSTENTKYTYWYTIVTYTPSYTRCETMNVGIAMGTKDNSYLKYVFLPMTSNKVRGFLYNHTKEQYEYAINIRDLESIFDKVHTTTNTFNYNVQDSNINWEKYLKVKQLPKEIDLSNISFIESSAPDDMFKSLVKLYIGKSYVSLVK